MADDLEDTGPAGGNPNASRAQPNFPDADSGGGGGGGGGDNGSDERVPDPVRNAAQFVGIDVPENARREPEPDPDPNPDPSGSVVDDVVGGVQETAAGAVDRARDVVDDVTPDGGGAGGASGGSGAGATPGSVDDAGDTSGGDTGGIVDDVRDAAETAADTVGGALDPGDGDTSQSTPATPASPGQPGGSQGDDRDTIAIEEGGRGTGAFNASDQRLQEQARQLEQQVLDQSNALDDPSDVRVVPAGDRLQAVPTASGRQSIARQSATGVAGVAPSDVEVQIRGGEVSVTRPEARSGINPARAAQDADEAIQDLRGSGVSPADLPAGIPSGRSGGDADPIGDFDLRGGAGATEAVDIGGPQQRTRSPNLFREGRRIDTDRTTLSPLAGSALTVADDDTVRQAVEGSREVAVRASEGNLGAEVAEIGRRIQEQGTGIQSGVEETLPFEDVGPEVGGADATVGEQVESFVGGTAAFPSVLTGGAVQAGGVGAAGGFNEEAVQQYPDRFADAAQTQQQFVEDRPVEAGLIGATAAVGSPRARARARSAGRRAAEAGRDLADPSGFGQRFRSDTRAQLQFSESSRGGQRSSRDQSGLDTGVDPRVFEQSQGRGGGRRSGGLDGDVGGRGGPRSGLEGARQFRQQVQQVRSMASEGTQTTLQEPAVIDPVGSNVVGQTAQLAAGADFANQFESQLGSDLDAGTDFGGGTTSQVTGQRPGTGTRSQLASDATVSETGGGPADQVTQELQAAVAEAQAPRARLDDTVQTGQTNRFDGGADTQTGADVATELRQDQATRSEVTSGESGITEPVETGRGRAQPRDRVGTGADTDTRVGPVQDQTTRQDIGTPGDTTTPPRPPTTETVTTTTGLFTTGLGDPQNPGNPGNRNRPRPPGVPGVPAFPGGNSPGSGGDFGFDNDRIFESGIASGRDVFEDTSSDGRRRDDDDDGFLSGGDFEDFFSGF
jgi:hypothetical protein